MSGAYQKNPQITGSKMDFSNKTPISSLYEQCAQLRLDPPVFNLVEQNDGKFTINCNAGGFSGQGSGNSKQEARHNAAENVLQRFSETGLSKKRRSRSRHASSNRFDTEFVFHEYIGDGAYGAVFKAENKCDGHNYAIKCVWLGEMDNDAMQEKHEYIFREVQALAQLDNPHILKYNTSWIEDVSVDELRKRFNRLLPEEKKDIINRWISPNSQSDSDSQSTDGTSDSRNDKGSFSDVFQSTDTSQSTGNSSLGFYQALHEPEVSRSNVAVPQTSEEILILHIQLQLCQKSLQDWLDPQTSDMKTPSKISILHIQLQLCQKSLQDWLREDNDRIFGIRKANPHDKSPFELRDRSKVLSIFEQIVKALRYIHGEQRIHRDLKPANILFALDNRVVVGDFGSVTHPVGAENNVSSSTDGVASSKAPPTPLHTANIGTELYCAPETLHCAYDEKVDIFSLGIVFFELLHPFNTESERRCVLKDAKKQVLPAELLPDDQQLLKLLLSQTASDRPSAADLMTSEPLLAFRRAKTSRKFVSYANSSTS